MWLLAFSPILLLLTGMLLFKWEAPKAGALSWFISIAVAWSFFGANPKLLALANSKGISLSIYVLLIIWSAIFLYNIVERAGAAHVISKMMQEISDDKMIQCLLLSWCFTSLLQGIAGFGVPVAVVAPIMVAMGFDPITSVTCCLIGHSWAISFGSMGSSYNAIQLVTKIPGALIGQCMALVFTIAIFSTGFSVAYLYDGNNGIRKSIPLILCTGTVISFALCFMNFIGIAQLASLAAGIGGCLVLGMWAFIRKGKKKSISQPSQNIREMTFNMAASPYYAVILLSMILQVPIIKSVLSPYHWGLDYPAIATSLGHTVQASAGYSRIQFFSHPAPILLVSAVFGICVFTRKQACGVSRRDFFLACLSNTVRKCVPTSVGIAATVMMALVMGDSGMTNYIARGIATILGKAYPIVSPFIGALGTFITGSNTNSNIMFGIMQYETAIMLGKNAVLIAAAQSVGGSLGVAIAPSAIMTGAANVCPGGCEGEIMKVTMRYCLVNLTLVGLFVLFLGKHYQ
ncbi:MAG: L-lactate permease [Treponema sp.]|nr:L-lactate permease [Treponema sp.]